MGKCQLMRGRHPRIPLALRRPGAPISREELCMSTDPQGDVIRISKEEASSSHVDDLLKRQMSLRGERGVTRDRGRKWYYQNWFVLMVVATLGALTAWAIIEPFFDDLLYFQGVI